MNKDTNKDSQKPEDKDVLAVIVNWNGKDDVVECLGSLMKVNYPREKFRIVVVDNGSSDGSQSVISKTYPDVVLLKNSKNLGC
ncbi:MAG: glycosyltransferase [Candidatus Aminicenantaceae bacterium]